MCFKDGKFGLYADDEQVAQRLSRLSRATCALTLASVQATDWTKTMHRTVSPDSYVKRSRKYDVSVNDS